VPLSEDEPEDEESEELEHPKQKIRPKIQKISFI
jgi:hypothetical protein